MTAPANGSCPGAAERLVRRAGGVSRRDLVLAASAALLARPAVAAAQDGDAAILERLIAREDAAAHAHGIAGAPDRAADEAAHAKALRTHLAALGREAPPGGPRDPAAQRLIDSPSEDAAAALEADVLAEYEQATAALAEPSILRTAATVMASHAQHHALLRRDLGLDPLR